MNDYSIEDLSVGLRESFKRRIEPDMVTAFVGLSGDVNPLHCDEEYARSCGYPGTVVHGLLTSSLYSTLIGVHLPGKRCLLNGMDIKFHKPVFLGDELTVTGEVAMVHEGLGLVKVKAWIANQDGAKVSSARIQVLVREDGR